MAGAQKAEYGTGGMAIQPVYEMDGKKVVRSPDGKPMIKAYRLKRYVYVYYKGERHKVTASVKLASQAPSAVAKAETEVRKLLKQKLATYSLLKEADEIQEEIESAAGVISELEDVVKQEKALTGSEDRASSLTIATLSYILDQDRVRASVDTRRIYESYWRNYIAVPPILGSPALGDFPLSKLDAQVLRQWEKVLYQKRSGFKLNPKAAEFDVEAFIKEGLVDSRRADQPALSPTSVKKILQLVSAVCEWALADRGRWSVTHNAAKYYAPWKKSTTTRKKFAPQTDLFHALVAKAEELGLSYMIPFMALVRHAFRPGEARGLRWCDLRLDTAKGQRPVIAVGGTIKYRQGGEIWVSGAKTDGALEEVTLSRATYDLLLKHRVDGSEFICCPPKGARKPFLTRDLYEQAWNALCEACDVPEDTAPYALKHGLISELLLAGMTPDAISLMTRHTSSQMIMRIYNTLQSADLADKIDSLGKS